MREPTTLACRLTAILAFGLSTSCSHVTAADVVQFSYAQTDVSTGSGNFFGQINGVVFSGDMPTATLTQNDASGREVPVGMVGYLDGVDNSNPGSPFGVHLGFPATATIRGERVVNAFTLETYELEIDLVIPEERLPEPYWSWQTELTDDPGGNVDGNDAFGEGAFRVAGFLGAPREGHRLNTGSFGRLNEGEVDRYTVNGAHLVPGRHAVGDELGLGISLVDGTFLDGSGPLYVNSIRWTGGVGVDMNSLRVTSTSAAADFDRDNVVGPADFRILATAFNTAETSRTGGGDLTADERTDLRDFALFRQAYIEDNTPPPNDAIRNPPRLTIDRITGAATISNHGDEALEITGYSILSDNRLLSSDSWTSLASLGNAGWTEVNPQDRTALGEVSLDEAVAVSAGESVGIGRPWRPGATHPDDEDVRFEVTLADHRFVEGDVRFTGPPNNLTLRVDPRTGEAEISHQSRFLSPLDVLAYAIVSDSESLNVVAWTSFHDTNAAGAGWVEANPGNGLLSELNPDTSFRFENGTVIQIGPIFDSTGEPDLVFEFATEEHGMLAGTVVFEQLTSRGCSPINILSGDLDGNGMVGFPDFLTLSRNFNRQTDDYAEGDVNCNGTVDFVDFLALSGNFGMTLDAVPVPEPDGLSLTLLSLGCFALGRTEARTRRSARSSK